MAVLHNVGAQLEKIDQQIINLIEHRIALCQDALEEDSDALSAAHDAETVAFWTTEADQRGIDETGLEKVCKSVLGLCRKMGEN